MDIRTATTLRKNIIRTIRETADADDAADKIIGLVGEAVNLSDNQNPIKSSIALVDEAQSKAAGK
ncbi:hypothetical protein NO932_11770 [Pelagibacterium sp. 26DY04]|uniref:hypothetical protein n=1 Tax=Pelagibacterium sp. 26DY04 TaxID=2967130 RepID=UPI002816814F|nr:hypothetical protein [Pelagibacterium sp. 26DY04]WMT85606.1 hypothetical protein NO932_11770 [Pelagibacterium sp. 26DY04]